MRLTPEQRELNEKKIRATADQLLSGDIPPGGRCDVKTLASVAGVDRAAFYGKRPYALLREDFERRVQAMHTAGDHPDPRDAQIARLAAQITALTQRLAGRDTTLADLARFKTASLSRLAAQHEDITRLRRAGPGNLRRLLDRPTGANPSG